MGKDLNIGVLPPLNDGLVAVSDIVYAGTGKSLCALKAATGNLFGRMELGAGGRMRGNTFSWT